MAKTKPSKQHKHYDPGRYPDHWYEKQARKLGLTNPEDIQDAMQIARLAVWRGKTVRLALIDWFRTYTGYRRKDRTEILSLDYVLSGNGQGDDSTRGPWLWDKKAEDADAICARLDRENLIQVMLSRLSSKQKLVFREVFLLDTPVSEVSKRLGVSNSMTHHNVKLIRDRLRELEWGERELELGKA